jgi:hypothetical protein
VQWSDEFGQWLLKLQRKSREGHTYSRRQLELVTAQLVRLRRLEGPPAEDTAALRRVRQSKRYTIWRLSHPYEDGIAVRLIAWFPPNSDEVVVALFAGEKARIGDVFYDSVGHRADMAIQQWLREQARKKEEDDDD